MILSFENYAKKKKVPVKQKVEDVSHDVNYENMSDEEIGNVFEDLYYACVASEERINSYKKMLESGKLVSLV